MATKRGSLKDFTFRITGHGRSGKNLDPLVKQARGRALREKGEVPLREFGNISAGLPRTGRARKTAKTTLPKMGSNLRGKAP